MFEGQRAVQTALCLTRLRLFSGERFRMAELEGAKDLMTHSADHSLPPRTVGHIGMPVTLGQLDALLQPYS